MTWLVRIGVIASVGLCIGAEINRLHGPRSPERLERIYSYWDPTLRADAAPGRGIFLKFVNFPDGTAGEAFAQSIYYRAVYIMYPLPVLVTRPGVVVNEGKDFLADNSYPNEKWLLDHGVGTVVTVGYEPRMDRPVVTVVSVQRLFN